MKNISTVFTVLFSVVLLVSCASKKEREAFLKEAAEGGMAEVRLSELAAQKGVHAGVTEFARMMVADHGNANGEVARLAEKKRVELPADISEEHAAALESLSGLSGMDFDKAYMDQMIKDHEAAVALFKKQADEGSDKDVKAFAAATLPTLEEHLGLARDVRARLDEPGAYPDPTPATDAMGNPITTPGAPGTGAPTGTPIINPGMTPGGAAGVPGGS
jgi:putative membrane protein